MILTLTRYTTRLALRVKSILDLAQVTDWRNLQLVITPPHECPNSCHVPGSPWILTGCWPFHPTGIDLANPPVPDFAPIVLDAFETDDHGRVVFIIGERVWNLPSGRYGGILRVHPHKLPINIAAAIKRSQIAPRPAGASVRYDNGFKHPCDMEPMEVVPRQRVCELARFDIDLGPECAQHMVDQAVVEFARADCIREV